MNDSSMPTIHVKYFDPRMFGTHLQTAIHVNSLNVSPEFEVKLRSGRELIVEVFGSAVPQKALVFRILFDPRALAITNEIATLLKREFGSWKSNATLYCGSGIPRHN